MSDLRKLDNALETWTRHRANGTVPPIRTLETLAGYAKRWQKRKKGLTADNIFWCEIFKKAARQIPLTRREHEAVMRAMSEQ